MEIEIDTCIFFTLIIYFTNRKYESPCKYSIICGTVINEFRSMGVVYKLLHLCPYNSFHLTIFACGYATSSTQMPLP